jgi:hypothetical protein
MSDSTQYRNPSWWTDSHTSGWERTKEALRRDWEQTKADLTDGGRELNQDVGNTVKQATGKEPIPPGNVANAPDSWQELEPAMRYGHGARQHYSNAEWDAWNERLEARLRDDWKSSGNEESSWDRVKHAVRRGWESVKRATD